MALSHPKIDAALKQGVASGAVPGVVAMAATDQGRCYEGSFGVRRLGGSEAMSLDTVFRIASMTKAITCVAAMQLVERGKLSLDGPLPAIDPALAAPQVLTGFDATGRPQLRRRATSHHPEAPADFHTAGFSYPMLEPRCRPLHRGDRYARDPYRQARRTEIAADVRPRRAVGIRNQHRLGWATRRRGERAEARCLLP